MASTYRELNRPQNNRDFGTYGESFPPNLLSSFSACFLTDTAIYNQETMLSYHLQQENSQRSMVAKT